MNEGFSVGGARGSQNVGVFSLLCVEQEAWLHYGKPLSSEHVVATMVLPTYYNLDV
jgi:hypothetical protein